MDDRDPASQPRGGLLSGRYSDAVEGRHSGALDSGRDGSNGSNGTQPLNEGQSGGLLSRFGPDADAGAAREDAPAAPSESQRGWRQLAGGARRLGDNLRRRSAHQAPQSGERRPGAGDWRATDFSTGDLDHWDRKGAMPFEMPADPDAPNDSTYDNRHDDRREGHSGREQRNGRGERDERDERDGRSRHSGRDRYDDRDSPRQPARSYGWDDAEADGGEAWDGSWDTGSWDTSWAENQYDYPPAPRASRSHRSERRERHDTRDVRDEPGHDEWNLVGGLRQSLDDDAISESLNTLAQLGAVTRPLSRVGRTRLLLRRRPAAAAMLAFFLLGFMLTCCAPLIPVARLGYDTVDLARHAQHLQALAAGGTAALINSAKLSEAQADISAIQGDLYEMNGAVAVIGAPLGAVSHSVRNYQLLVRMGYDLASAANESIQVAQSLLPPLEGGALSSNSTTPGITPADIQQARTLLADAYARTLDAVAVYHQIDQNALPAQLKPGTKYGNMLALLPLAVKVFGELKNLIDAAPALLGVGQPAYYLAIAMDRTELRPGGGFQGNYGILELDGGKQSKSLPFGLNDTYTLDQTYATKFGIPPTADSSCPFQVTEPPDSAWWWPVRCVNPYGWGLRDSNLSADFPTNAQADIRVAEGAGVIPNGAPIQGVVAFTPGLIADILNATGPLPMPEYHVTINATNLEYEIHTFQLQTFTPGQGRKEFTHDLASSLLTRIKGMHGSGLKTIFGIAEQAIQTKDLQVYLSDPRAELILQQLGLTSSISTGGGDGFFVVDTNDGGNKANMYVTETQTDLVTLLPNGEAYHRLAISVTYDKNGHDIFNPGSSFYDYSDMQRTYLPGDATIASWAGYAPDVFQPDDCAGNGIAYATIISDCSQAHGIFGVTTASDTPGRTMVMGPLLVMCGSLSQDDLSDYHSYQEAQECQLPQAPHTETIFLSWYTPHAYTVDASGHGTYSELIEKQAGDQPTLAVYVTRDSTIQGPQDMTSMDLGTFSSLIANATKAYDGPLTKNTTVSYSF